MTARPQGEGMVRTSSPGVGAAPAPAEVRSYDDLAERLRALRAWAGLSYRELHRRVVAARRERGMTTLPSADTVHRCLQPGRTRMDPELVVDIARVLLDGSAQVAEWRQAYQAAAGLTSEAGVVSVTDTIPVDDGCFVGRTPELTRLLALAPSSRSPGSSGSSASSRPGPMIAVVEGMAGVGKTRLATRAAHRWAADGRFDLVLWVNLRGYDSERPPADPAAVLEGFLRSLGVAGSQLVGLDRDARSARYRALLANRRPLVVLDNAASDDQARPLLPDTPTSVVLVTSRHRLTGLTEAQHLPLGVFQPEDSFGLLGDLIGADRIGSDPLAAGAIASLVGHLPLALSIIGTRIAATPDWTLADHLARLEERRAQLRLDHGVELALATSYDALPPDSRRLFRLLGLHPGRDFDAYAAAALDEADLATTEQRLTHLCASNLIRCRPGDRADDRYEFHDLVRLFAASRGIDEERPAARQDALGRLCAHYLHTAMRAMDHHSPHDSELRPRVSDPGSARPALPDRAAAVGWLDAERTNLLATAFAAPDHGQSGYTVDLSFTLFRYLEDGGHFRAAEGLHRLAARQSAGGERGRTLTNLGLTCWRTGQYVEALAAFDEAITIHRAWGDRRAEARARGNSGIIHGVLGRHEEALDHFHQALAVHRVTGDRSTESTTLGNLGTTHEAMGRFGDALEHHLQFLAIARETGDRRNQAIALTNIGSVQTSLGDGEAALGHFREALELCHEVGIRSYEPNLHNEIGNLLRSIGQPSPAEVHFHAALGIATQIEDPLEQARAHSGLMHCATAAGDLERARRHGRLARDLHAELGTPEDVDLPAELTG